TSETFTLAELKAKIAWLEGGDGSQSYRQCNIDALDDEREYRDVIAFYPGSYEFPVEGIEIASSASSGTFIDGYPMDPKIGYIASPAYDNFWLDGPDKDLFVARPDDDDDRPDTGYGWVVETARPLPAGTYRVDRHWQLYFHIPCDYLSVFPPKKYQVSVTAPIGTVYEAFFDPVAIGAAVGADGTNGALTHTAFTVGMKWQDGSVMLELSTAVALTGHVLDFIALDGTVALSLDGGVATVSGGTLTWTVASQPWEAGDQLMLRIRKGSAAAIPSLDIDYIKQVYRNAHGTEPH
ncbi:MAG: hypothetical protein J4F46_05940, partial [Dehalococcoidia bacterium]|nr:hypothetical protein [Dehalococcoidia bacterium]